VLDLVLLASTTAFVGIGGAVGIRLLLLARHTRELPDFIVAFSLFDLSAIAYPLILLANLADVSLSVAKTASILSTLALALGWAGVFVFTQRVFRPGETWALALAWCGLGMLSYGAVSGLAYLDRAADRAALSSPDSPVIWVQVAAVLVYAWTTAEGFLAFRQARRRLRLGLADPLVVNRFLLWGVIGLASLLSTAPSLIIALSGGEDALGAVPRLCTAAGGITASIALQLAFLPPARYRAWIASGSAA
jgi:hypothetical protein